MQDTFRSLFVVIRDLAFLIGDILFCVIYFPGQTHNQSLVIDRLDGIGDFVIWLDAFRAIRAKYKDYRITLICNQAWFDLAKQIPGFDEVIPVEVRRLRIDPVYRYRTFRLLRSRCYALAIHPPFTRESFADVEALFRILRADEKIGSSGECSIGWRSRLGSCWFDRLIPAQDGPMMELVRNAEFVRGLGVDDFLAELPVLSIDLPSEPDFPANDYYILFSGGSDNIKIWPSSSFAEVGRRIHEQTGMVGVICGGPLDKKSAEEIASLSGVPMIDFSGKTSLVKLAALIRRSRLIVSNDSGAVHMATALSVPSVCILGGGHFGRFMPYVTERATDRPVPLPVFHKMDCYGCNWYCPFPRGPNQPAPCVSSVSVARVFDEVQAILSDLKKHPAPYASS